MLKRRSFSNSGSCTGVPGVAHYNYEQWNRIVKETKQRKKDAVICRTCRYMNEGFCYYHDQWCTSIDRAKCEGGEGE